MNILCFFKVLLLLLPLTAGSESLLHIPTGDAQDSCGWVRETAKDYDGFFSGGPQSFRVGSDGFFYVADTLKKRILRYDSLGQRAGQIPRTGAFPFQVTDFSLNSLSGLTFYNPASSEILVVSATGRKLSSVRIAATSPPEFVEWLEQDPEGNVYLKDRDRQAILIYDSTGKPIGGVPTRASSFAVDPGGHVFYLENTDGDGWTLMLYTRGQRPLRLIDLGYREYRNGRVAGLDGAGRLFFLFQTDSQENRELLVAVDSAGTVDLEKSLPAIHMFRRLVVTNAGQIYYAVHDPTFEKGEFRILRLQ